MPSSTGCTNRCDKQIVLLNSKESVLLWKFTHLKSIYVQSLEHFLIERREHEIPSGCEGLYLSWMQTSYLIWLASTSKSAGIKSSLSLALTHTYARTHAHAPIHTLSYISSPHQYNRMYIHSHSPFTLSHKTPYTHIDTPTHTSISSSHSLSRTEYWRKIARRTQHKSYSTKKQAQKEKPHQRLTVAVAQRQSASLLVRESRVRLPLSSHKFWFLKGIFKILTSKPEKQLIHFTK